MECSSGVRQFGRPSDVAVAIDGFGRAIDPFLAVVAGNPVEHPLTVEEFERAWGPQGRSWR